MPRASSLLFGLCTVSLVACGAAPAAPDSGGALDSGGDVGLPVDGGCGPGTCAARRDDARDVLSTRLELDLAARTGIATIRLVGSTTSTAASFEAGDLTITSVTDGTTDLLFAAASGRLDIGVPASADPATLVIRYAFQGHTMFDGWLPASGVTFLWPHFCGNLYPCRSSPSDGASFELAVTGVEAGAIAVFPPAITTEAPPYMPAIAVGDYTYRALGTTPAGTEVGVYYLPGGDADATTGTRGLAGYFAFYESMLGEYAFGDHVASVAAPWGPGAYGGMEHHPFWHVASAAMASPDVHAHEAAHGWFGDGVRITCWEDFVLSEGLASYLAARAIESVDGAAAGDAIWADYAAQLDAVVASGDTIALPDATCDAIDIAVHPLWSSVPYMKGAFFVRAVERLVGRAALDAVLRSFYEAHVGRAAHMEELIDAIETATSADLTTLEDAWLRSMGHPVLP